MQNIGAKYYLVAQIKIDENEPRVPAHQKMPFLYGILSYFLTKWRNVAFLPYGVMSYGVMT